MGGMTVEGDLPDSAGDRPAPQALRADGLAHRYGDVEALGGVSFAVAAGEFVALVGPNGGGKSTLLRILSTLLVPDAGAASVEGADTVRAAPDVRMSLGVVFQSVALDPLLTVRENLRAVAGLHGIARADADARIAELADLLGLGDVLDRPSGALSGGQRRRADLARGLLHRPRVLLLDEPTTALDPPGRDAFWAALATLRRRSEGLTVFAATHLLDEASTADRVLLLDHGRIVADGAPAVLCAALGAETLVLTPADAADTPPLAAALTAAGWAATVEGAAVRVATAASNAGSWERPSPRGLRQAQEPIAGAESGAMSSPPPLTAALDAAAGAGIALAEATLRRPTLADVFRARTAGAESHVAQPLNRERLGGRGARAALLPPNVLPGAEPAALSRSKKRSLGLSKGGDARATDSANAQSSGRAVRALWARDLAGFVRDRARLGASLAQPLVFWVLLAGGFGPSFRPSQGVAAGVGYGAYLVPGTLALVVVMTAIFATIHVVEERQSGFLQAALVAPVARGMLAVGLSAGGATLGTAQAALVALAAPLTGISTGVGGWTAALVLVALLGLGFTAVGVAMAWRLSTTRAYHGVMMGVLFPLWAISGAVFPLDTLPMWARAITLANPLTYAVEGLRGALGGAATLPLALCLGVTAAFSAAALALAARATRRAA